MDYWADLVPLKEVVKIDRTAATNTEAASLPYVGLEHIEKDYGHFTDDYDPKPQSLLATKFIFNTRHILYGKLRPYLNKVALPYFGGVCTTEILPLLPNENRIDREFLWAYLLTPKFVNWASSIVTGANLPRLDPKELAEHLIPLPPLTEQKRLAAILQKADRLRQQRHYALDLSSTYLHAVFIKLFGNPVTNKGKWPVLPFDEICDTRLGKMLDQKNQTGLNKRPYLRNVNVQWDRLDLTEVFEMDFTQVEREEFRLKKGDLLICEGGEVGRAAIWNNELAECYYQKALHRARPDKSKSNSEYLLYFLWIMAKFGGFNDFTSQVTIAHLTGEKLATIPVPLPPLPLQEKFAIIAHRYERLRTQQREALRQANHLFDTLLHRAFTGQLSPSIAAPLAAPSPSSGTAPTPEIAEPIPALATPGQPLHQLRLNLD